MSETKVKVIETRSRPPKQNGYMMIMRGIRTKEAAEAWGVKYGFATVYWIRAEEKVYGVSIAEKAEEIETQSTMLLAVSERGSGCLEFVLLVALVAFVLFVVLKDVPW